MSPPGLPALGETQATRVSRRWGGHGVPAIVRSVCDRALRARPLAVAALGGGGRSRHAVSRRPADHLLRHRTGALGRGATDLHGERRHDDRAARRPPRRPGGRGGRAGRAARLPHLDRPPRVGQAELRRRVHDRRARVGPPARLRARGRPAQPDGRDADPAARGLQRRYAAARSATLRCTSSVATTCLPIPSSLGSSPSASPTICGR